MLIYSTVTSYFSSFFVALIISCFITKLKDKVYTLFEKITLTPVFLNNYVVDDVIRLINYFPSLVLITTGDVLAKHLTGPRLLTHEGIDSLNKKMYAHYDFGKVIDIVGGAIDKERSDPKHGALHDIITGPIKDD